MTYWKSLIILQASHLRLIFQAGTLTEYHCPREKVLRHSQPNRWLVPRGHEDTGSARACSADLWFQRSAWAEMIMQAVPWAPSSTIKVIRGAPPLHIQPYGEVVDGWVFNCCIVDPSPHRGLGSLLCSRSAEFHTAQTLSLSLIRVSNLGLFLAFSQRSRYQPIYAVPTKNLTSSCQRTACRASGERGKWIRDWLSLLRADPPRLCHVKSFSLPCTCLLRLQPIASEPAPMILRLERDHQRYSQWLVKGIFIWKTNDYTLKGNESLSEQPLCPVLNYFVNLTCNHICAQTGQTLSRNKDFE